MTTFNKLILQTFACFCLGIIFSAQAQTRTTFVINPGYTIEGTTGIDADNTGGPDLVNIYLNAGRSYQCSVANGSFDSGDEYMFFDTTGKDPNDSNIVATANGSDYPAVSFIDGMDGLSTAQQNMLRFSITAQTTGTHSFAFMEKSGDTGSESGSVNCRETTLYGGYNRFFAGVAIIELQNASSKDIPVKISIVDSSGTTVVPNQESTAKASTRTDVIFPNLPSNNFGQIIITHEAPFGALSGVVAEYDFGSDGSITLKRERPLRVSPKTDSSTN